MTAEPQGQQRTAAGDQRLEFILSTAERMFFEKGYRGVSIRDLAAAVGFQVSSLYYYFPSKEEILYRLIRRHLDRLLEIAAGALEQAGPDASATTRARLLVRASVLFLIDDRQAAGITISQGRELRAEQLASMNDLIKRYEGLYVDLVKEGMASGEFIEADPMMAVYIMLGAQVRLSAWFRPRGRLSAGQVADTYSYLLVRSLVSDPAALERTARGSVLAAGPAAID